MKNPTQKEIIQQQTIAIQHLSNRLLEVEVLMSSVIDLVVNKGILSKDELEVMIKEKVDTLNDKVKEITLKTKEDKIESYPYFGKMGEA